MFYLLFVLLPTPTRRNVLHPFTLARASPPADRGRHMGSNGPSAMPEAGGARHAAKVLREERHAFVPWVAGTFVWCS